MYIDFYEDYIENNKEIIYKICRIYSSSQDEFDDYFQEVCLQLIRLKESYQHTSKLSIWVFRVALNTCLSIVSKEKKTKFSVQINKQVDRHSGYKFSEEEGQLEKLYNTIRMFKKIDRALILLYLEDYSHQDISIITGIIPEEVDVKINTLMKQLTNNILWKSLA